MFNKKGVSLVTVLLFMLIATIAGTATYKWLSSAHGSSASRMNIAEAQQASRAGLDAVRAWMTYHANDVGAVMHQYINGGNKPVKLDAVVKAFGSHKQDYSVWLTGVDASTNPYRLKITSVGTARGGVATYSENSILRVNGLYRVRIPEKHLGINFDGAFAGQHAGITGSDSLESGLITGDFEANNIPVIYSKMVITGKAKYGGDINHLGDVYIGKGIETTGKITFGNATTTDTLVAYVGGRVKCADGQPFTVYGDLYLVGPVEKCILDVKGNLTVAGNLQVAFSNNNYKITVGKNMVFTETGKMDFNKDGANFNRYTTITVGGNLYLPDKIEAHCTWSMGATSGECGDTDGDKMITVSGKVFRYNATNYYKILQQNSAGTAYGIYMNTTDQASIYDSENYNKNHRITSISATGGFDSQIITEWSRTDNVLKNINPESKYWENIDKMNAYGNLIVHDAIPQPILIDHEDAWKADTANSFCGGRFNNTDGKFDMDDDAVDSLNDCYTKAELAGKLYNGFLIIKWNYNQNKQPSHTLDHKFVLYATTKLGGDPYLPPTSDDGMVLLYLEHGAGKLFAKEGQELNYVIYSKDNVEEINGLKLTGTMILEPGARLLKTQGKTRLQFGRTVVNTMAEAGLIKENPEYTAVANPDGTGGAYAVGAGTLDDYYVATAPQLNISLESQYKNKEIDPTTLDESKKTDIQPSVIVMPRVIYVPQNLVGKLSDYYSVLNLNKAADKGNASVACNPGGITTGSYTYNGKTLVPDDIYTCKYASTYGDNPFYVVVSGKKGKTPAVTFETPNWTQITAGGSPATVNMLVKQATGSANMTVGVNVYNLPDSWTLVPQAGVSAQSVTSGVDGMRAYVVTFKANEAKKPLFKISAPVGAGAATVHFELAEPLSGCVVGTPSTYEVSISGAATVNRVAIPSSYCTGPEHQITGTDNNPYNCASVTNPDWPNCDVSTGVWVYPYCNSLVTISDNDSWTCGTNYAIRLLKMSVSSHCIAFIPDTSLEAENGGTYTLYASLKSKPYKLYVKTVGTVESMTPQVSFKKTDDPDYTTISPIGTEGEYQVYQVYANYYIKVDAPENSSNHHKYWECRGPDCTVNNGIINRSTAEYRISGVDTLIAHYNERDDHCFFDSFGNHKNSREENESFKIWCPDNNQTYENCIDRCKSGYHCSIGTEGHAYQGYDTSANWMLIYANSSECVKRRFGFCTKREYRGFTKPSTSGGSLSEILFDDGLLRAPGTLGTNLGALFDLYAPTFLLHRAKAGANGKLSLKMKLPVDATELLENFFGEGDNYDDGAVLRSDAAGTSYLSVTLYRGYIIADGSYGARVRVCYVEGLDNDGSHCLDKNFTNKYNGSFVPMESLTDVTMNITLDGASLKVDLDYNTAFVNSGSHDLGTASFDLTQIEDNPLAYGAQGHEYIGLKMFNTFYRYKDISWTSDTYSDKCFDTPRIYCSFANQYLGGTVPKDSNVTPWVSMSSWFDENNCKDVEYYYNGCDMNSSLFDKGILGLSFSYLGNVLNCSRDNAIGGFWDKGSKLKGSTYNFEDQGYHKIDTSRTLFSHYALSGYAKNATVEVTCGSTTYSSDCGVFYVGDIVPCTKHERSFEQNKTCADNPCYVDMPDDAYANLRDSKISMTISGLNGTIEVYLIDQNNVASSPYSISTDGTHEFYVSQVLEKIGFDPQTVKSVRFEGEAVTGIVISDLQSYCNNAPGIFDCNASFDGNGFAINATITNTINAAHGGCTISNNEEILDDVTQDCPVNGTFYVQGSDVYEALNGGTTDSQDYTFTITLTDKENVQTSCQTNTVNVQKTTLHCDVDDGEIDAGDNLPAFKYYMENCPTGGCKATVELVDKVDPQSVTYNKNCTKDVSCEYMSWTPSEVNTVGGTELTYQLKYSTLTPCEATVKVNEVIPAKASDCRVEEGVFKANITAPSSGAAKAKLWYNDFLGNVIGSEVTVSEYTEFSQEINLGDGSYTLVLTLNGDAACSVPYPDGGSSSGESGNGSGNQNSGENSGGNSGENSGENNSSSVSATCSYTTSETTGSVSYTISSVSGCDNNDCVVVVKKGDVEVNGMGTTSLGSTGMSSSAIEENGTYTVFLNGSALSGCSFTVTMNENNNSGGNNNGGNNNGNGDDDDTPSENLKDINLSCVSDISGGAVIPSGTRTIKCSDGANSCFATNVRCCPASDCYNGSVSNWKVGNSSQSTSPRLHDTAIPCTNGGSVTITSSGDLKCMLTNH